MLYPYLVKDHHALLLGFPGFRDWAEYRVAVLVLDTIDISILCISSMTLEDHRAGKSHDD